MGDAQRREWGASGLAHLTGWPSGPPDFFRAAVLGLARVTAEDLGRRLGIAASRFVAARDAWCAITLSRPDDVDAVPALVQADEATEPWGAVAGWAAGRTAAEVVARARPLGLPAAVLSETAAAPPLVSRAGAMAAPRDPRDLLVVDLSSMWAGPLCGQLLRWAGATVVKVESTARPDGTRGGPPAFLDW